MLKGVVQVLLTSWRSLGRQAGAESHLSAAAGMWVWGEQEAAILWEPAGAKQYLLLVIMRVGTAAAVAAVAMAQALRP